MWDVIRELAIEGTTILLTTQYLEEADRLADQIAVIDGGSCRRGHPDELRRGRGRGARPAPRTEPSWPRPRRGLGLRPGGGQTDSVTGEITIPVGADGTGILTEAVRRLDAQRIVLADIALRRPTLDDVFLSLTGHAAEELIGEVEPDGARSRRKRR
jgi:ABC-2 type transport system ATP-binding protein